MLSEIRVALAPMCSVIVLAYENLYSNLCLNLFDITDHFSCWCPRYMDGERLTDEDEKAVVENLLTYHPHSEDKIGCGLDSIMVEDKIAIPPLFFGQTVMILDDQFKYAL